MAKPQTTIQADKDQEGMDVQEDADLSGLAQHLNARFNECQSERRYAEEEWLINLRQYLGQYDDEEGGQYDKPRVTDGGSQAFIRITRTKIRTVDSRIMDILFPGGAERNWQIDPTPRPELPEEVVRDVRLKGAADKLMGLDGDWQKIPPEVQQEMEASGQVPDFQAMQAAIQQYGAGQIAELPAELDYNEDEFEKAIMDEAKKRAAEMTQEISDQLDEGRYRREMKKVVHSGHLYGTGWLKGPLAEQRMRSVWTHGQDGQWAVERNVMQRPFFEFVPVWDVYPDSLDATTVEQCEGIFQRYIMTKAQLRGLKKRKGFKADVIEDHIVTNPQGDAQGYLYYENELRTLKKEDRGTLTRGHSRRYEVVEWTGYADGQMLAEVGMDFSEDDFSEEFKANVWMVGGKIVRASLTPFDDSTIDTYHRYVFEESDTGILGIGVAELMRDPQRMFNAAIRAMLNNMGLSSGPMYEANIDLLDGSEVSTLPQVFPRRVWARRGLGTDAAAPAIRAIQVESRQSEFMALAKMALELGDESSSVPRVLAGDEKIRGAGQTASGLSMLLGAANISLKEPLANFDEGITKPFLRAMYHWNMQFNERNDIKGDFEVSPTGSTSLMAKEVQTERLEKFAAGTMNPIDEPWINRGEINRARARANELDPDVYVKSDKQKEQADAAKVEAAQAQQEAARAQPQPGAPA